MTHRLDVLARAMGAMRAKSDVAGVHGYGVAFTYRGTGRVIQDDSGLFIADGDVDITQVAGFTNLITTAGDQYIASKVIVGIGPAAPSAPTAANGMKLGAGSTAVAKSGAGGALVTYLTGSNVAFDATFAKATAVAGTDLGWNSQYQTTWAAGVATTASPITEVAIVNDQATNLTSTAANTYSRALLAGIAAKAATDSLIVAWNWKHLGS